MADEVVEQEGVVEVEETQDLVREMRMEIQTNKDIQRY